MEILIVMAILSGVVVVISIFTLDVSNFGVFLGDALSAQQEIQLSLSSMATEIRSMGPSANGSYPIESASSTSFTFYSDIDGDNIFERVRYFVQNNVLKRGVIEPSGNPIVYSALNEQVMDLVHDLVLPTGGSIFYFYDKNYDGSQSSMSAPVNVVDIRMTRVLITADKSPQNESARITFSTTTIIRNLKDDQ